jgi:hypothetical protein
MVRHACRDRTRCVDAFDTREHSVYTEEEPNSLAGAGPTFLANCERFAVYYAFPFLGFTTGPSTPPPLRPLRRDGSNADIKRDVLLIRRSKRSEVVETT